MKKRPTVEEIGLEVPKRRPGDAMSWHLDLREPPERDKLFIDDLIPTHIVYDGDDETFRGAYGECLDYLRNQRDTLIGSQIHIAPIVAEVELQTKGSDAKTSDFVIFEDEDE